MRKGWVGAGSGSGPAPAGVAKLQGVRIAHNSNSGVAQSTQATLSLTQSNSTKWDFNFCDQLVFPQIAVVRVHVVAASGFPTAIARPPNGCELAVETNVPVTGTITVDVDSSESAASFA